MAPITETKARESLQAILDSLKAHTTNFSEANLGKEGFVGFHIQKIYAEGGGKWDGSKAAEYIQSLEAETYLG